MSQTIRPKFIVFAVLVALAVLLSAFAVFACDEPKPTPTSSPTSSSSASSSSASSSSTATIIDNSKTSSSAAGGDASVKDSGNSFNKNVNKATGGSASATGGTQSQSSQSSASNNGSNVSTVFEAPKIPVSTAVGYAAPPTVSCFKGYGAGGQGGSFGLSITGGRIDQNCAILEAARSGAIYANRLTYCKVYVTNKQVKKAGVTLEDCMHLDAVVAAPTTEAQATPPAPPVVVDQQPLQLTVVTPPVTVNNFVPASSTPVTPAAKKPSKRMTCHLPHKGEKPNRICEYVN